jgi:hypothetical protein
MIATKKPGRKVGRPSAYSPALVESICDAVASGKVMSAILKMPGMPTDRTVRRWKLDYPDFDRAYARAREASAEYEERRVVEIRDAMLAGLYPADVARVAIDASFRLAKARDPARYGDRRAIDPSNEISSLSDAELQEQIEAGMVRMAAFKPRGHAPAAVGDAEHADHEDLIAVHDLAPKTPAA